MIRCTARTRPGYATWFGITVLTLLAASLAGCTDDLMHPGGPASVPSHQVTSALSAAAVEAAPSTLPEHARAGERIPGQYIVVFHEHVADAPGLANALVNRNGGAVLHTYSNSLRGFAARLPDAAVEALARNPNVASVEPDQLVSSMDIQAAAPWALDRIDQSGLPLDSRYDYPGTGAGVHLYIIDSGIRPTHAEFAGRLGTGVTFVDDGYGQDDCLGHGTHVAGIAGGTTFGVAKEVALHSVRVFGCEGSASVSTVIAAVDWVTANAQRPAVANLSLGGSYSTALNQSVTGSIASGVTYAIAAGNYNTDACKISPASTPEAITVAASSAADSVASFSNWGSCIDLYAPGVNVLSAWHSGDQGTRSLNGTSMASPAVAGAAALFLEANPGALPAEVASAIVATATANRLVPKIWGTNNALLNVTLLLGGSSGSGREKPGGGGNGKGKGRK